MLKFRALTASALVLSLALISGCNDDSSSSAPVAAAATDPTPPTPPPATLQCDEADRLPAELLTENQLRQVTNNLPNVYDTANYDQDAQELDTTTFNVSVALPERCPGDRFPVVINSHGYGGEVSNVLDEDGAVDATAHFPQILDLFQTLPHHGYVAVSFDQRGHGESQPDNAGGLARVMDPQAETQDAIRLLDWLAENAEEFHIYREDEDTGIADDFRVGLIGYSYGGGWQFPLSQLDARVDTIVPVGTWHSLINSLLPGDAVKLSFDGLLCLFADGTEGPQDPGVTNTPAVADMCNLIGYRSPLANLIRSKDDLMTSLELQGYDRDVVLQMFNRQVRHFQDRNGIGPWCEDDRPGCTDTSTFVARSVPALLLQGNRDVLFNLTEAYWNYTFLSSLGSAPVGVLTNEGGHMNPLDNLFEGDSHCGAVDGLAVIRSWFDFHLKGEDSPDYQNMPSVCISVADTDNAHNAQAQGLLLDDFPKGSQSAAAGGVPARLESGSISIGSDPGSALNPVFLEVFTVPSSAADNYVLAGIPSIDEITVQNVAGNPQTAIAFFGVGIKRGDRTILVDAEVTGLVQNPDPGLPYTGNPNVSASGGFLLPGVGERLQAGDKVGLVFFQRHVQFSAVISGASATGATTLLQTALGTQFDDPIASAANEDDTELNPPNPYTAQMRGIELPVFDLRLLPANALSQGPVPSG